MLSNCKVVYDDTLNKYMSVMTKRECVILKQYHEDGCNKRL